MAIASGTPVIAFTATRWGTLLKPHPEWSNDVPTAVDCYGYCLAEPAVHTVFTAPKTIQELETNLAVLQTAPMNDDMRRHWNQFGDIVYRKGGGPQDDFESRWP